MEGVRFVLLWPGQVKGKRDRSGERKEMVGGLGGLGVFLEFCVQFDMSPVLDVRR